MDKDRTKDYRMDNHPSTFNNFHRSSSGMPRDSDPAIDHECCGYLPNVVCIQNIDAKDSCLWFQKRRKKGPQRNLEICFLRSQRDKKG